MRNTIIDIIRVRNFRGNLDREYIVAEPENISPYARSTLQVNFVLTVTTVMLRYFSLCSGIAILMGRGLVITLYVSHHV